MKVKFLPQNIELEIQPDQSVLKLAMDNDIFIKSICRGLPSCAECRVRLVEGGHNVLPPGPKELNLIGTSWFVDNRRLSCQIRCFGDITVDLSEQVEKAKTAGLKGTDPGAVKDQNLEDYAERQNQLRQEREDRNAVLRHLKNQPTEDED